jgi:hypothetical protein
MDVPRRDRGESRGKTTPRYLWIWPLLNDPRDRESAGSFIIDAAMNQ